LSKWQSINFQWIGMMLGGIISLILITIFSNSSSYDYINHIVTINIIALIIIFCLTYLILFRIEKYSRMFKRFHFIIFKIIIGIVFGLMVGLMSYEGEIYWFVLGFVIVSLIPVVNMLAVVFLLGSTIIISYNPDVFIPIFNDFLPIQLVDGSFKEIAGLPFFIIPIFVFLGFLIPISVSELINKKKIKASNISEQTNLKNELSKFESKLKKWEFEGYNITLLKDKQKNCNLKSQIQNLRDYESKIEKLKQFKKDLQQMNMKEFDYDVISIKKKFKDPYKVDEIESDISALKNRFKLKIEELVEKSDFEIKKAISATDNSDQLNYLKNLQDDLIKFSKNFVSIENSYKDAMRKIKEIHSQVLKQNVPPKRNEISSENHIEKQNFYEILNIKPDATQNQIKKMFKRLSLAFHPDTEEDTGVDGDQKFRMIMEAYETLKDPDKRKKYDEEIGIKK